MYGYENNPHVAGAAANAPHVGGVNAPHQPVMPYSYVSPAYGYGAPCGGNTFAIIVVLFILLIIIGATIYGNKC